MQDIDKSKNSKKDAEASSSPAPDAKSQAIKANIKTLSSLLLGKELGLNSETLLILLDNNFF